MVRACVEEVRSSLKIDIDILLLVIEEETFGEPKTLNIWYLLGFSDCGVTKQNKLDVCHLKLLGFLVFFVEQIIKVLSLFLL
jgi:hypothetical protein